MKMDIAKVLEMDECKHLSWVHKQGLISDRDYKYYLEGGIPTSMILADLAFRLRDEVMKNTDIPLEYWAVSVRVMFLTEFIGGSKTTMYAWFINCAQPIHWILAAILAKEQQ